MTATPSYVVLASYVAATARSCRWCARKIVLHRHPLTQTMFALDVGTLSRERTAPNQVRLEAHAGYCSRPAARQEVTAS